MKKIITLFSLIIATTVAIAGTPTNIKLVNTDNGVTTIQFVPGSPIFKNVTTPGGTSQIVTLDKGTALLIAGAPDMEKLTTSLIIPDFAKMEINIISSNYYDLTGIDIAPSKVAFKIYDLSGAVLLEETHHIGALKKIAPYLTEEITASIPTRLPAGTYKARYAIYNGEEVKQEGELSLSILPYGTLQSAGFGFIGLSLAHKVSVLLPIFVVIIFILFLVYNRRERRNIQSRAR